MDSKATIKLFSFMELFSGILKIAKWSSGLLKKLIFLNSSFEISIWLSRSLKKEQSIENSLTNSWFEFKNSEERYKVLYQELNDRILKLEFVIEEKTQNIPQEKPTEVPDKSPQAEIELKSEELLNENSNLVPLVDKNIELDEYAEAESLIKATRYKEAFEAFDKFIVTYPNYCWYNAKKIFQWVRGFVETWLRKIVALLEFSVWMKLM